MQAARGTSLTSSEPATPTPVNPPAAPRRTRLVFLLVALAAWTVDLTTKQIAVHQLADRGRVDVVGDLFGWQLTRNPGAAFSAGTGFTEVFAVLAIAAIVVVLWVARRLGSTFWAVGLGLLLAGVAGNLTDRLFRDPGPMRGHVVDFMELPHWPIFNVADVCINIAAAVIIIQAIRGVRLDGTRHVGTGATGDTRDTGSVREPEAGEETP